MDCSLNSPGRCLKIIDTLRIVGMTPQCATQACYLLLRRLRQIARE